MSFIIVQLLSKRCVDFLFLCLRWKYPSLTCSTCITDGAESLPRFWEMHLAEAPATETFGHRTTKGLGIKHKPFSLKQS